MPGLILCTAHVGFADLAQQAGFTMPQAVFMVGAIWALPAMVVLVGAVMSGVGLVAVAVRGGAVLGAADADGRGAGARAQGNVDPQADALPSCAFRRRHLVGDRHGDGA